MRYFLLVLFLIPLFVNAADTYKKGWDKSYVADCANPTARADGVPLDPANNPNDVIDYVMYYVDIVDGNTTNPYYFFQMPGGCQPMTVDLQQFPTGYWFRYAVTKTMDGMESGTSVSNPFSYTAKPNPPSNIK